MSDPVIFDSTDRPVVTPLSPGILLAQRLWTWIGIPGLTLLVLVLQTCVIWRQANIMQQQTSLITRQSEIAETQQKLASRPNLVTQFSESNGDRVLRIENVGSYSVRDLRFRILHFKKFVQLGWHDSISGEASFLDVLKPGNATTVDLKSSFFPYSIKDKFGNDYPSVPGGEFYVVALVFGREIDDKRYLFLQPLHVLWPGEPPMEWRPDRTAMSGPVAKNCTVDAYAVELAYEYYKRNPLPYPAEAYNYHYLVGEPKATCLQSGPKSLRW
jgi:hypothetical protein